MKQVSIRFCLFLAGSVGAGFGFWFLLNQHVYAPELTNFARYAIPLNNGLFFLSLFLILLSFFLKPRIYKILGCILILVGLCYLILMLSFPNAEYLYLIPLGMYVVIGYLMIGSSKQ